METLILAVSLVCAAGAPGPVSAAEQSAPVQTKGEYTKKAHETIDSLSVKIDALEVKAKNAGDSARAGLDEQVKALKVRRTAAKKDLRKLKRASGKAWAKLKAGVDKGIDELQAAYEEAAKD